MSSFEHQEPSKAKKIIKKTAIWGGSLTGVFALVAGINYVASPRITEQQAAIRVHNGHVTNSDVSPGVKMDNFLPGVKYVVLPTTLQKTTVSAAKGSDVTIRTEENSRIYGNFEIHFMINKKDPNFKNAYQELKVDSIDDIKPFINNYTVPAAVAAYQKVSYIDINTKQPDIAKDIVKNLQATLDEHGYSYIKILDVIPSGVGLSDDANASLENIVKEQRKKTLLQVQGQVAELSKKITQKQTDVTIEAIMKLKKQGHMTTAEAIELYYMQRLDVNDKLGQPGVAGVIPGTGVGTLNGPGMGK